jgi:hypothetical protein
MAEVWSPYPAEVRASIQQIEHGRLHRVAKTLFLLTTATFQRQNRHVDPVAMLGMAIRRRMVSDNAVVIIWQTP